MADIDTPTDDTSKDSIAEDSSSAPLTDALEPTDAKPEEGDTHPSPIELSEVSKVPAGEATPESPAGPPAADILEQAPATDAATETPEAPATTETSETLKPEDGVPEEPTKDEAPAPEAPKADAEPEAPQDAPVPIAVGEGNATGSGGAATAPTSIEGGDKPGVVASVGDTVITAGIPSVKVGDDHVAYNVDQQTISAALASAAARGVTLAAYLQEQGVALGTAPDLTAHVEDKHGKEASKTHREWSVVIREFYSEDSEG